MRKVVAVIAGLLALAMSNLAFSSPASATTWGRLDQGYNYDSVNCATPQGDSTANGAVITTWACNSSSFEGWAWNGQYLVNQASGKCLTPQGDSYANGTVLTLWTCNNAPSQRWTEQSVATSYGHVYRIMSVYGATCITNKGNSNAEGVWLTLWTCNSNWPDAQDWAIGSW